MTIRRYTLLAGVLLLAVATTAVAQDAGDGETGTRQEVALVTAVSGNAAVADAGGSRDLTLGMKLHAGDEVSAREGKTSLVFLTGDFFSLKAGERIVLGATLKDSRLEAGGQTRGLEADDGTKVSDRGIGTGRKGRVWQAQLASVSGIRGDGLPIAVAPRLAVAGENPRFYWFDTDTSDDAGERRYVLVLKNEENAVLARQTVQGRAGRLNSFRFETAPAGFETRARVHYHWTVLRDGAALPEGELDASFVFVDQAGMEAARAQMQRLETLRSQGVLDETSFHTLQCAYLLDERERLFSDGLPHVLALAALPGGQRYAGEQLAQIFLRFGNQVSTLAPLFLANPAAYLP